MSKSEKTPQQQVIDYFKTAESRTGYTLLLKGTKHFGFYPEGQEHRSFSEAQINMEKLLVEKLQLPAGSLLLDAGCGEGSVSLRLAVQGFQVEGIDLLDFAIAKANRKARQQKLADKARFQIGDYTQLNFPDATFDGVFTLETLVHVADYSKALSEFHRTLKPGGKLALFEYSLLPRYQMTPDQELAVDRVVKGAAIFALPHFIHGSFPGILEAAGFSDIQVENATPRIMPMLQRFHQLASVPHKIIQFIGLQEQFINTIFAAEWYHHIIESDIWRYNIITATKPK